MVELGLIQAVVLREFENLDMSLDVNDPTNHRNQTAIYHLRNTGSIIKHEHKSSFTHLIKIKLINLIASHIFSGRNDGWISKYRRCWRHRWAINLEWFKK